MHARHTLARSVALTLSALVGACGASHPAPDAAAPIDGAVDLDGGTALDAGPGDPCAAEDAHQDACPAVLCDGPPNHHWDGERCVAIDCGACVGADCAAPGTRDLASCEAAHAACVPQRCRATGGEWQWWAQACGHFRCGVPPEETCFSPAPACNCGAGQRFDDAAGCVADPSCGTIDPLPPEQLCARTGGTWAATCCASECGQACLADCAAMACTCGPLEIFDPVRGCVVGRRCVERLNGETCEGPARCEDGSICCQRCGGAGCFGPPTCQPPVCDDNPHTDACGNDDRAV